MPAADYRVLRPADLQAASEATSDFARDVLAGLTGEPKTLPCRWIYDATGSELFQRIMHLPEYYPFDCERDVLTAHRRAIGAAASGQPFNLVELGAGDGSKTNILLEQFVADGLDFHYCPIDISEGAMADLVARLGREMPGLRVEGIVSDYFDGLRWLSTKGERQNLVLFLGGNIGNFSGDGAHAFLHHLWNAVADGDRLLIGLDLRKDIEVMQRAYADSEGVTAAFNLNLLARINRELGGHFDLERFRFFSTWDPVAGAIQSWLISRVDQTVRVDALEKEFAFREWEPIHTESSHKYRLADTDAMAAATGYAVDHHFLDARGWFCDALWRVVKPALD